MKITKAEFDKSYDDRVTIDITVDMENDHEESVELAKSNMIIVDDKGNCIAGTTYANEEDCFAEKGESFSLDLSEYVDTPLCDDFSKVTAVVDLTTFKREFKKLGEIDCPQDHKNPVKSDKSIDFGDLRVYGVVIAREKPPENKSDDHDINIKVGVKNMSDKHIQLVKVKCLLVDSKDSVIEDNDAQESLPGNASITLQPYLRAKSGKMKGATIKVNISTYHELTHFNAESILKPAKD